MKNSCTKKQKQGFTLAEVMVALFISALAIPAAISTNLMLLASVKRAEKLNDAQAQARLVQQFFVSKINSSGVNIRHTEDGNTVIIQLYNESSQEWHDAALTFNENERSLQYSEMDEDGGVTYTSQVAAPLYRDGNQKIFSAVGQGGQSVNFCIYSGELAPGSSSNSSWRNGAPGVYINLSASPRNAGSN